MSAYLEHFGLNHHPFTKELEDSDLWLPPSKQGIVDELVEAIQEHGSGCCRFPFTELEAFPWKGLEQLSLSGEALRTTFSSGQAPLGS